MSVEAMAWALRVPVGGSQKIVLLGVANYANPNGEGACPSLDILATYANCRKETVKGAVRELLAAGWLIEDGVGVNGTRYRIPLDRNEDDGWDVDAAQPSLDSQAELASGDQPTLDAETEELKDRFMAYFRKEMEAKRGERLPPYKAKDHKAARELVTAHPEPRELAAVLACALKDHRGFARRVHTISNFKVLYGDIRVVWLGKEEGRAIAAEIAKRNGKVDDSATQVIETNFGGDE